MKKFLSLVLALVMTMSLVTISSGAKDFTDDSSITYKEAVDVMSAVNVIDGYAGGEFRPTNTLTRGAAAKIICNLILGPTTAGALRADTAPYSDVPTNNTFAGYIAFCKQSGIISGYADGTFRPAASLTGYAFMKMLLGALGYDAKTEGYVGNNWSIQVAKRALNIGLDDGLVTSFNGQKAVTREEAMLYAFNTMKATMVEYENESTIIIDGVGSVVTSSAAKEMTNNATTETIKNDNKMQFAERYFTDLKMTAGDRDEFNRPATTWRVKSDKIGTYADTPDLTYTTGVKNGTIYTDLGNKVAAADVSVYVDGQLEPTASVDIVRGGKAKIGDVVRSYGNGVLTQVYYDADNETMDIIQVNTYVGKIDRVVDATSAKDAYVVISDPGTTPTAPATNLTFETEDFAEDDVVIYTYSKETKEVESVANTEMVTGTVTEAQNKVTDGVDSQNVTLGGDKYVASNKFGGDQVGDVTIDGEYNVYMDSYGYMILLELVEDLSSDYALVMDTTGANNNMVGGGIGDPNQARLLFANGDVKVVQTAKNYNSGSNAIADGTIVTYRADEDGVYTIRAVTNASGFIPTVTTASSFGMVNGRAWIERNLDSVHDVYANSGSTFVIYNDGSDSWESYTGIKNAPTVSGQVTSYTYVKNGMVKIMFIVPADYSAQVVNSGNKNMYLVADSASNLISDGNSQYYVYNAIVDGEITTVKVDKSEGKNLDGFYSNYNIDKYGVYDNLTKLTATGNPAYYYTTGVSKTSLEYTVSFGYNSATDTFLNTYTVADDADIYYVDEDNAIEASSYGAIGRDYNDKVSVIVKDNQITTLVIEYVDDTVTPPPASKYELWNAGSKVTTLAGVSITSGTVSFSDSLYFVDISKTPVDLAAATNVQVSYEIATFNSANGQWNAPVTVTSVKTANLASGINVNTVCSASYAVPGSVDCMVTVTITCDQGTVTYPAVVVSST